MVSSGKKLNNMTGLVALGCSEPALISAMPMVVQFSAWFCSLIQCLWLVAVSGWADFSFKQPFVHPSTCYTLLGCREEARGKFVIEDASGTASGSCTKY